MQHPSLFLDKAGIEKIRQTAHEAESLRRLHDDQLHVIYQNKWFKMFVPERYGGLALTLPDILKIEECLSWADGSTGWVVTLCSGAGWFVGFLDPSVADELFKDDRLCIAGSGAVTGTAEVNGNSYEVSGRWKYASGSLHAKAFTVNCYIKKSGQQLYNPDGSPKISSFILKASEVKLHHTWNCMGMTATGSHSFEVNRVLLPRDRCFTIHPGHAVLKDTIYRYPFLQLAETTLAVNMSGMAVKFIDLAEAIFEEKEKLKSAGSSDFLQMLVKIRTTLNESRRSFFDVVEGSWDTFVSENEIPDFKLKEISSVSQNLVFHSRESVNRLYPYCGLEAAVTDSEINRVWRNFHTAGQHTLFNGISIK